MEKIPYIKNKTLRENITRYLKHNNTSITQIAKTTQLAPSTINNYVSRGFLTENMKESKLGNKIKAFINTFFIDGIPNKIDTQKKRENLYALFQCENCQYSMHLTKGCFKFGLTKEEINAQHHIETRNFGGFRLSSVKRCPYARESER